MKKFLIFAVALLCANTADARVRVRVVAPQVNVNAPVRARVAVGGFGIATPRFGVGFSRFSFGSPFTFSRARFVAPFSVGYSNFQTSRFVAPIAANYYSQRFVAPLVSSYYQQSFVVPQVIAPQVFAPFTSPCQGALQQNVTLPPLPVQPVQPVQPVVPTCNGCGGCAGASSITGGFYTPGQQLRSRGY